MLLLLALAETTKADDATGTERIHFDIPQQRADFALTQFAEQADLTLVFPIDEVKGRTANRVVGEYRIEEAVGKLLFGTGLLPTLKNQLVLNIAIADESKNEGETMNTKKKAGLIAVLASVFAGGVNAQEPSSTDEAGQVLEEIVVTGTHIRGTKASIGSKLTTIDRQQIDQAGFATIQEIMHSLPQNFKGGISEDTVSFENDANFSGGTSVNLRGLGADATLTLINGRRVAQGGNQGGYTDISTIPTSAIERIEVLADGASATYGSDAIGGVVNVILRDDYDGAETRLRLGTVTEGDSDEIQVGQILGNSWDTGHALISYELYKRENLGREERSYASSSDLRPLGGDDFRTAASVPGNILDPDTFLPAYAIPDGQDGTNLIPGDLLPDQVNLFNGNPGRNLFKDQERHSVFLTASQEVSDSIEMFVEGRYNRRGWEDRVGAVELFLFVPDSNPFYVSPAPDLGFVFVQYNTLADFGPGEATGDVEDYGGVVGGTVEFGGDWQLQAYSSYSERKTDADFVSVGPNDLDVALADPDPATAFNPFGIGNSNGPAVIQSLLLSENSGFTADTWAGNVVADGSLSRLPGGNIKLAIGVDYYESSLESQSNSVIESDFKRDVSAVFGEVLVPLVGDGNRRPGFQQLLFTASVRYEDYSDVGDTTNPKFGVLWTPVAGLNIRASYGTSFKAPNLKELDETDNVNFHLSLPDTSSPSGSTLALLQFGNNAELKNEEANTWSVGFDFSPSSLPDFEFDLSYYNIEFKNRISTASSSLFSVLDQEERFASAIIRNPSQTVLDEICNSGVNFFGIGCSTTPVGAIVDARLINSAITKTDGLDFNIRYGFETETAGRFDFDLGGTYILSFDEAFSPTAPITELLDTVGNPIGLRMRNSVSWENNSGMSAIAFVNYTDSYKDNASSPERKIDSLTTVDLTLAYNSEDRLRSVGLNNTVFTLNTRNLFDSDPPFVNNFAGIAYDPENASPLGRFISFTITKKW